MESNATETPDLDDFEVLNNKNNNNDNNKFYYLLLLFRCLTTETLST